MKIEKDKMANTIKTTFDLRTCFTNMQNEEGVVSLSKTQWEEILKQIENDTKRIPKAVSKRLRR